MDLRLSTDPSESFRIFQGRLLERYLAMSTEFDFRVIDANQPIEVQQDQIRALVTEHIDLAQFKRRAEYYVRPVPSDAIKLKWRKDIPEDQPAP